jgi:pheromone shutdown-related protein TraB
MGIAKMSRTREEVNLAGRKIVLIGTAHVSKESIAEVKNEIESLKPDCVAVELDEKRYNSMMDPESWKNLDIVKVLKRREGFLMLANLVLSSFQKRMGKNVGVKPGDEMLAAINCAKENNILFTLVDRPIQITLRRAWAKNSLWGKCKLLASMIASAFDNEEISEAEIEKLKSGNEMDSMMKELSEYLPSVKEVLIDERDRYLASHIWESEGNTIVAVLGAGHLPGVKAYLEKLANGIMISDTSDIETVSEKSIAGKVIGWGIPVVIVALIVAGFFMGGRTIGTQMIGSWILWNGCLSALGALVAFANPITVLVAFVGAPLTSLCPLVGVGLFTGIVQALICKPKVSDIESLQEDVSSLKGWYKNRVLKVLLVFFLSSLGSTIGTFVATGKIASLLTKIGVK